MSFPGAYAMKRKNKHAARLDPNCVMSSNTKDSKTPTLHQVLRGGKQ